MKSKLNKFLSDKSDCSLNQKIDTKGVEKIVNLLSPQIRGRKIQNEKEKISSPEEYCDMLKKEFNFAPELPPKNQEVIKVGEANDSSSSDDENYEAVKPACVEIDSPPAACPPDSDRVHSGEVVSFVQKKNLAQGMMDMALVSANCNQLRYVLDMSDMHPYFLISIVLIVSSLTLQVIVGLVLMYSNSYNLKQKSDMQSANKFNNFGIYGVFLITLTNFLISAFSGANTGIPSATSLNGTAPSVPLEPMDPVV